MGRFSYKPGAIYEVNKDYKEIWQDSGALELYKDAEARLMVFDDTKIPINRTKYLELSRDGLDKALDAMFTPNGIGKIGNFGDIPVLHEYYNYLEDRLFGKYPYLYEEGRFDWEDTEHSIIPIDEDITKLRNCLIFFISRLDYINSVLEYNFDHLNRLYRKYYTTTYGTLLSDARDLLNDIPKYWKIRDMKANEEVEYEYREVKPDEGNAYKDQYNYWDEQINIYRLESKLSNYTRLVASIEESVDYRLYNLDKYLGENAFIDYDYVLDGSVPYDKEHCWLLISMNEIKVEPVPPNDEFTRDGRTYKRRRYTSTNWNGTVHVGDPIWIYPDKNMKTNHPDGYIALTGHDYRYQQEYGLDVTYVFSNSELVKYDAARHCYIAKKPGVTHMFIACHNYNNIKSNVITINIV